MGQPCGITWSPKRGLCVSIAQARRLHAEASVFPPGTGCVGSSFLPLRARGAAPVGRTSHGASKICEKQPRNAPNAQANTKANIVGEGQGRPAREARRDPEGGPGEPPEWGRKGSTDKKRFPHLRAVRNQEEPSRNQALWDECVLRGPIFGGIAPPSNYNIILKMGRPRKGPPGELRKGPPTAW